MQDSRPNLDVRQMQDALRQLQADVVSLQEQLALSIAAQSKTGETGRPLGVFWDPGHKLLPDHTGKSSLDAYACPCSFRSLPPLLSRIPLDLPRRAQTLPQIPRPTCLCSDLLVEPPPPSDWSRSRKGCVCGGRDGRCGHGERAGCRDGAVRDGSSRGLYHPAASEVLTGLTLLIQSEY
jgi:hypothetical protein